jgi:hypothetical protein
MSTLEDLIRDSMRLHELHAPNPSGLLSAVASREQARRRRLQGAAAGGAVAVVASAFLAANMAAGGQQHPGGATPSVTAATPLPGGDVVSHLAAPVTVNRTGSAVVEIGAAPAGADHLDIELTCLSAGTFTVADGASMSCSTADAASDTGTMTYELHLDPGQHTTTITTAGESRWRLTVTYSTVRTTAWGVNKAGQTFGVANANGTPTLVAVDATNGKTGYAYARDLDQPQAANPSEALAWQNGPQKEIDVPVYTSDGKTVIGTFVTHRAAPPK